MPTHEEHILRIPGDAKEPLFASEIAEHLNGELRPDSAYSTMEVAKRLKGMSEQVAQLLDGRWMLNALITSRRLAAAGISYPIEYA